MLTGKAISDLEKYLLTSVSYYSVEKKRLLKLYSDRKSGRIFSIDEYIEGMIRAFLTNSVPWSRIHPHLVSGKIKKIFLDYNCSLLKSAKVSDIITDLRRIRCGNIRDKRQVGSLKYNIEILEKIIKDNGSIENYLKTKCKSYPIIEYSDLSDFQVGGKYKLAEMGIPLVCEFLKNMGYDLPKPDVHLKRFLSKERVGGSKRVNASEMEVFSQVDSLAIATGMNRSILDLILWCYCAKGFGEICCAKPNCKKCVLWTPAHTFCAY